MKQIVIIGAGISGLYLAYKLLKMNHKVTLIEKEKHLGGRMYTEQVEIDGQNFDIEGGAGVVRNDEKDIVELLKELNIPISFWKSQTKIIYHQKKNEILDYDYPKILNQICRYSENELSFIQAIDDSNITRKEKIGVIIGTTYGELFDANSKHVCDENDFNEFLLKNEYEYGKPKAWTELVSRLEKEIQIMEGKIIKDRSVTEIGENHVITNLDERYTFDSLIITCPYHFVKKISLPKSLTPWKTFMDEYHQETDYLRVYTYFEEPIEIEAKIATNLPIRRVIPITSQLVMTVYTDGPDAKDIYRLHKDDRKLSLYIQKELGKLLDKKIPNIKKNWTFFWEKGISSWKPSPLSVNDTVDLIHNPMKNIYFCGDTYSVHPGWIQGAMESCNKFLENLKKE